MFQIDTRCPIGQSSVWKKEVGMKKRARRRLVARRRHEQKHQRIKLRPRSLIEVQDRNLPVPLSSGRPVSNRSERYAHVSHPLSYGAMLIFDFLALRRDGERLFKPVEDESVKMLPPR